jgi:hypothetical protein
MVFIYLAHTVLNGGGHAGGFVVSFEDGLGSTPAEEESGHFSCGEACFDTDAIKSRSQENDPFQGFLALSERMFPLASVQIAESFRDAHPCPSDTRPPAVRHPHLLLLGYASHILC